MPGMSGVDLARAIAATPQGAGVPLILLSSMGVRETADSGDQPAPAFTDELSKPLKPHALQTALIRALGGSTVSSAPDGGRTSELDPEMASRHPLRILLTEDNAVNQRLACDCWRSWATGQTSPETGSRRSRPSSDRRMTSS